MIEGTLGEGTLIECNYYLYLSYLSYLLMLLSSMVMLTATHVYFRAMRFSSIKSLRKLETAISGALSYHQQILDLIC